MADSLTDRLGPADTAAIDASSNPVDALRPVDVSDAVRPAPLDVSFDQAADRPLDAPRPDAALNVPDASPDAPAAPPDVVDGPGPDTASSLPRSCYARHPGALFCDDFEDGLPVSTTDYGHTATPNGLVRLETRNVARGSGAAWLRVGDASGGAIPTRMSFFYARLPTAVTTGALHFRMRLYVPTDAPTPTWAVVGELTDDPGARLKVSHVVGDAFEFWVDTAGFKTTTALGSLPRGRWMCVEMVVDVAATGGRAELFVDGVSRAIMPAGNTRPTSGWTGANFGAIADGATAGTNVLVDEVVIGTSRFGCN